MEEGLSLEIIRAGETDFPTGEVVLADPVAYLGTRYETVLDKRIPAGSYPVELSVCHSRIAGLRIAGARLIVSDKRMRTTSPLCSGRALRKIRSFRTRAEISAHGSFRKRERGQSCRNFSEKGEKPILPYEVQADLLFYNQVKKTGFMKARDIYVVLVVFICL